MIAVPAIALAGSWEVAAVLWIAERTGKAMRNPPRDAILSHASSQIGRGWAFGLHEALDQAGATIGPLGLALVLYLDGSYEAAFAILVVPAALCLTFLLTARAGYPNPSDFEAALPEFDSRLPLCSGCICSGRGSLPSPTRTSHSSPSTSRMRR
jgi:hypothetical protein